MNDQEPDYEKMSLIDSNKDPDRYVTYYDTAQNDDGQNEIFSVYSYIERRIKYHGGILFNLKIDSTSELDHYIVKINTPEFDWSLVHEVAQVIIELFVCDPDIVPASKNRVSWNCDDKAFEEIHVSKPGDEFDEDNQLSGIKLNKIRIKVKVVETPRALVDNRRKFKEIQSRPDKFGVGDGRFVLKTLDGQEFFVHYSPVAICSPHLKAAMDENQDGIRDGEPFPIRASKRVLLLLLYFIYIEEAHPYLKNNVVEVVTLADSLLIPTVEAACASFMRIKYKEQDFDTLMQWFLKSVQLNLINGQLERKILGRLARLTKDDAEKRAFLELQIVEYLKVKPNQNAAFIIDLLNKADV